MKCKMFCIDDRNSECVEINLRKRINRFLSSKNIDVLEIKHNLSEYHYIVAIYYIDRGDNKEQKTLEQKKIEKLEKKISVLNDKIYNLENNNNKLRAVHGLSIPESSGGALSICEEE